MPLGSTKLPWTRDLGKHICEAMRGIFVKESRKEFARGREDRGETASSKFAVALQTRAGADGQDHRSRAKSERSIFTAQPTLNPLEVAGEVPSKFCLLS